MANLTLRTTKGSPLTHVELDANFVALNTELAAGNFDSGISVGGGAIINDGDLEVNQGNLILRAGDIHYNPKLGFYDLVSASERMRIDSEGSLLVGSTVNSQDVNLKVARSGYQHALIGNKTSNSGQMTRLELGPGGDGTETGAGLKATQATANFNDWQLDIFTSNSTDGHVDAITINRSGETTFNKKVVFGDSAEFTQGIEISGGDLNISGGGNLLVNGNPISAGTVSSVGASMPTGFTTTGSPVTNAGTITVGYATAYSLGLPSNALQGQWSQAYGWGDHSLEGYLNASDLTTSLSGYVQTSRTLSTTNGVQGGGDLSANRTISLTGSYTGDYDITGNLRVTQDVVAFYNTSDERLKKDITPITDALDKVSQLNGVDFEYIASGIQSTGLIAQDVKKVSPTAVFEDEDGHMGVRYQVLTGLLVEAIKELKAEIAELKKV